MPNQEILTSDVNGVLSDADHYRSPDRVIHCVLAHFDLTWKLIAGRSRMRAYAYPRQVCMYLLYTRTKMTLDEIGARFGGRHHTTAMSAKNTIIGFIETDEEMRDEIDNLNSQL